jgi:hypothetical protein
MNSVSENNIGDNATIIQGDVNATFNTSRFLWWPYAQVPTLWLTVFITDPQEEERERNRLFLEKISKTDPFYDKKRLLELNRPFLHESFESILKSAAPFGLKETPEEERLCSSVASSMTWKIILE